MCHINDNNKVIYISDLITFDQGVKSTLHMHPYAVIDFYSTIETTLDALTMVWPGDGEQKIP